MRRIWTKSAIENASGIYFLEEFCKLLKDSRARATLTRVHLTRVQGEAKGRARNPRDIRIARGAPLALLSSPGLSSPSPGLPLDRR